MTPTVEQTQFVQNTNKIDTNAPNAWPAGQALGAFFFGPSTVEQTQFVQNTNNN